MAQASPSSAISTTETERNPTPQDTKSNATKTGTRVITIRRAMGSSSYWMTTPSTECTVTAPMERAAENNRVAAFKMLSEMFPSLERATRQPIVRAHR